MYDLTGRVVKFKRTVIWNAEQETQVRSYVEDSNAEIRNTQVDDEQVHPANFLSATIEKSESYQRDNVSSERDGEY